MGLDMYAGTMRRKPETPVDFKLEEGDSDELHYWRKHPNLHGWMEDLYYKKGGTADSFNCTPVELTAEDLDKLEADIKAGNLPETRGFFFGATNGDERADDLNFIQKAREALNNGLFVYYDSWW